MQICARRAIIDFSDSKYLVKYFRVAHTNVFIVNFYRFIRRKGEMKSSRFMKDIREAVRSGRLKEQFRASDVRIACPGWAYNTYSNFLPKHREGNPQGCTEYFIRHPDGSYSLLY